MCRPTPFGKQSCTDWSNLIRMTPWAATVRPLFRWISNRLVGCHVRMHFSVSQSMAKATQARRDSMRKALLAALRRLDEGEFGYCDACGDDIAPKRLELDPTATRCIGCASG